MIGVSGVPCVLVSHWFHTCTCGAVLAAEMQVRQPRVGVAIMGIVLLHLETRHKERSFYC